LVPKDEGMGIMISAMTSREFGRGIDITKEQLETINGMCLGQTYRDGESAKAKRGTAIESPLTCSPFIREFEYGSKERVTGAMSIW